MSKHKKKGQGKNCPRCGKPGANTFVALDNKTSKKTGTSHAEVCFNCAIALDR